ncbi:Retrovirus-related Pol polyprotein from transposon TNT 1-94 [Cucumis melo var. makuwa]|uniref:Retrovirus-related Pol polyprotein from transposon TNT 1-94 n=1 Tax=Cucumis melo var. makuwa TaxID=1194695 RepID=A0A5A7SX66_CUCMM|nr:Retrovirus-related Pol polyprotein from transposon TNT 1-94 [Cucumis melo var. makuwa]
MVSKAYKIYQPPIEKMVISRDVQFLKDEEWDWTDEAEVKPQEVSLDPNELVDDAPVIGLDY